MYFLGIDTSTTSSKSLIIDERGEVIAVASNPHTLQTPRPLWSEQDPREWWEAVSASIKSVLEGVSFGLRDSFTLIQNAGLGEITQVRASGGGTKDAPWRQIMASVLGAELVTVNTTERGAYGAALLAGVGAGAWSDVVSACRTCIKITGNTQSDPRRVEAYQKAYEVYRELYPALKGSFLKL